MSNKLKLSVNARIVDKNRHRDTRAFAEGWHAKELTLRELSSCIDQGFAFSAQFKDGYRRGKNFICADFVAADFDGGVALSKALEDPLVREFGSLVYTTPTHQMGGVDRFRIVFATATTITNPMVWANALMGLALKLGADRAATDPARLFFGCKGSHPRILGNRLSPETQSELVDLGTQWRHASRFDGDQFGKGRVAEKSRRRIDPELLIRTSRGDEVLLKDLGDRTPVHCPFHDDDKPSAFVVHSTAKRTPGVHCKACGCTFWIDGWRAKPYNFYRFDDLVADLSRRPVKEKKDAQGRLYSQRTSIINERYLPPLTVQNGMTLVKSPKGTGKTEAICGLVREARTRGQSVLLIGHRRTLLSELSAKLKLDCYLDDEHPRDYGENVGGKWKRIKPTRPDYYAVSVDSLPVRLSGRRTYDVVVIDEIEQVLAHVTAATLRGRSRVLATLKYYVGTAPAFYGFDADLNQVTLRFVGGCRQSNLKQSVSLLLNKFRFPERHCQMFKSDQRLVRDMLAAIQHGERIFVVCNSKRRAKAIDKLVAKTCGDRTRRILVTADDVEEDRNVQELLGDIKTEILRYDVVIASPAIGTGVDITFPGNEQLIDTVYGFFNSQINSHYDIDQQLGRVRNPKKLKVWVSPREENFETEESVVMLDIVQNNEIEIPNVGYGDDGIEQFDCDDPLLTLLTDVYCSQRASQNRLHHYFVKHKERDGWKIVEAATEEGDEAPGPAFKEALREIEDAQHERLLCAKKIAYETYEQRSAEAAKGVSLSPTEALELERYEIEDFYQRDLTLDLIHKDDHGRLRQRVQTYENLCSAFKYGAADAELSEFLSSGHWRETLGHGTDHLLLPSIALVARVVRDGDFDLTRELERGDLAEFVDFCQRRSVTIERYLKIKIRRDIARDPVRMLNLFLSLAGQGLSIVKTTKRRGAKVYRYRLDPDRYAEIREIVDFRHAERKRRKEASLDPAAKAFFEGVARRNATYRAATHATAVSRDDGG